MKSHRKPRIGVGMKTHGCEDISEGSATVVTTVVNKQCGWVLPGGKFTRDRNEAVKACKLINREMMRMAALKAA